MSTNRNLANEMDGAANMTRTRSRPSSSHIERPPPPLSTSIPIPRLSLPTTVVSIAQEVVIEDTSLPISPSQAPLPIETEARPSSHRLTATSTSNRTKRPTHTTGGNHHYERTGLHYAGDVRPTEAIVSLNSNLSMADIKPPATVLPETEDPLSSSLVTHVVDDHTEMRIDDEAASPFVQHPLQTSSELGTGNPAPTSSHEHELNIEFQHHRGSESEGKSIGDTGDQEHSRTTDFHTLGDSSTINHLVNEMTTHNDGMTPSSTEPPDHSSSLPVSTLEDVIASPACPPMTSSDQHPQLIDGHHLTEPSVETPFTPVVPVDADSSVPVDEIALEQARQRRLDEEARAAQLLALRLERELERQQQHHLRKISAFKLDAEEIQPKMERANMKQTYILTTEERLRIEKEAKLISDEISRKEAEAAERRMLREQLRKAAEDQRAAEQAKFLEWQQQQEAASLQHNESTRTAAELAKSRAERERRLAKFAAMDAKARAMKEAEEAEERNYQATQEYMKRKVEKFHETLINDMGLKIELEAIIDGDEPVVDEVSGGEGKRKKASRTGHSKQSRSDSLQSSTKPSRQGSATKTTQSTTHISSTTHTRRPSVITQLATSNNSSSNDMVRSRKNSVLQAGPSISISTNASTNPSVDQSRRSSTTGSESPAHILNVTIEPVPTNTNITTQLTTFSDLSSVPSVSLNKHTLSIPSDDAGSPIPPPSPSLSPTLLPSSPTPPPLSNRRGARPKTKFLSPAVIELRHQLSTNPRIHESMKRLWEISRPMKDGLLKTQFVTFHVAFWRSLTKRPPDQPIPPMTAGPKYYQHPSIRFATVDWNRRCSVRDEVPITDQVKVEETEIRPSLQFSLGINSTNTYIPPPPVTTSTLPAQTSTNPLNNARTNNELLAIKEKDFYSFLFENIDSCIMTCDPNDYVQLLDKVYINISKSISSKPDNSLIDSSDSITRILLPPSSIMCVSAKREPIVLPSFLKPDADVWLKSRTAAERDRDEWLAKNAQTLKQKVITQPLHPQTRPLKKRSQSMAVPLKSTNKIDLEQSKELQSTASEPTEPIISEAAQTLQFLSSIRSTDLSPSELIEREELYLNSLVGESKKNLLSEFYYFRPGLPHPQDRKKFLALKWSMLSLLLCEYQQLSYKRAKLGMGPNGTIIGGVHTITQSTSSTINQPTTTTPTDSTPIDDSNPTASTSNPFSFDQLRQPRSLMVESVKTKKTDFISSLADTHWNHLDREWTKLYLQIERSNQLALTFTHSKAIQMFGSKPIQDLVLIPEFDDWLSADEATSSDEEEDRFADMQRINYDSDGEYIPSDDSDLSSDFYTGTETETETDTDRGEQEPSVQPSRPKKPRVKTTIKETIKPEVVIPTSIEAKEPVVKVKKLKKRRIKKVVVESIESVATVITKIKRLKKKRKTKSDSIHPSSIPDQPELDPNSIPPPIIVVSSSSSGSEDDAPEALLSPVYQNPVQTGLTEAERAAIIVAQRRARDEAISQNFNFLTQIPTQATKPQPITPTVPTTTNHSTTDQLNSNPKLSLMSQSPIEPSKSTVPGTLTTAPPSSRVKDEAVLHTLLTELDLVTVPTTKPSNTVLNDSVPDSTIPPAPINSTPRSLAASLLSDGREGSLGSDVDHIIQSSLTHSKPNATELIIKEREEQVKRKKKKLAKTTGQTEHNIHGTDTPLANNGDPNTSDTIGVIERNLQSRSIISPPSYELPSEVIDSNGYLIQSGHLKLITLGTDIHQLSIHREKKKKKKNSKQPQPPQSLIQLQPGAHHTLTKILIGALGQSGISIEQESEQLFQLLNLKEDGRGLPPNSIGHQRLTNGRPTPKFLHSGYNPTDYSRLFQTLGQQENGLCLIIQLLMESGVQTRTELLDLLTHPNCGQLTQESAQLLLTQVRTSLIERVMNERQVARTKKNKSLPMTYPSIGTLTTHTVIDTILTMGIQQAKSRLQPTSTSNDHNPSDTTPTTTDLDLSHSIVPNSLSSSFSWLPILRTVYANSSRTGLIATLVHLAKHDIPIQELAEEFGINRDELTHWSIDQSIQSTPFGERFIRHDLKRKKQTEHQRKRAGGQPCSDTSSDSDHAWSEEEGTNQQQALDSGSDLHDDEDDTDEDDDHTEIGLSSSDELNSGGRKSRSTKQARGKKKSTRRLKSNSDSKVTNPSSPSPPMDASETDENTNSTDEDDIDDESEPGEDDDDGDEDEDDDDQEEDDDKHDMDNELAWSLDTGGKDHVAADAATSQIKRSSSKSTAKKKNMKKSKKAHRDDSLVDGDGDLEPLSENLNQPNELDQPNRPLSIHDDHPRSAHDHPPTVDHMEEIDHSKDGILGVESGLNPSNESSSATSFTVAIGHASTDSHPITSDIHHRASNSLDLSSLASPTSHLNHIHLPSHHQSLIHSRASTPIMTPTNPNPLLSYESLQLDGCNDGRWSMTMPGHVTVSGMVVSESSPTLINDSNLLPTTCVRGHQGSISSSLGIIDGRSTSLSMTNSSYRVTPDPTWTPSSTTQPTHSMTNIPTGSIRPIPTIRPLSASSGEIARMGELAAVIKAQRMIHESIASTKFRAEVEERLLGNSSHSPVFTSNDNNRLVGPVRTNSSHILKELSVKSTKLTTVERALRARIARILISPTTGKRTIAFPRTTNVSSSHFFGPTHTSQDQSMLPPGTVYDIYSSEGPIGLGLLCDSPPSPSHLSTILQEELLINDGFVSHRPSRIGDAFYPRTDHDRQQAQLATMNHQLQPSPILNGSHTHASHLSSQSPLPYMMVSRILHRANSSDGQVHKEVFVEVQDIWGLTAIKQTEPSKRVQMIEASRIKQLEWIKEEEERIRRTQPPNLLQQEIDAAARTDGMISTNPLSPSGHNTFLTTSPDELSSIIEPLPSTNLIDTTIKNIDPSTNHTNSIHLNHLLQSHPHPIRLKTRSSSTGHFNLKDADSRPIVISTNSHTNASERLRAELNYIRQPIYNKDTSGTEETTNSTNSSFHLNSNSPLNETSHVSRSLKDESSRFGLAVNDDDEGGWEDTNDEDRTISHTSTPTIHSSNLCSFSPTSPPTSISHSTEATGDSRLRSGKITPTNSSDHHFLLLTPTTSTTITKQHRLPTLPPNTKKQPHNQNKPNQSIRVESHMSTMNVSDSTVTLLQTSPTRSNPTLLDGWISTPISNTTTKQLGKSSTESTRLQLATPTTITTLLNSTSTTHNSLLLTTSSYPIHPHRLTPLRPILVDQGSNYHQPTRTQTNPSYSSFTHQQGRAGDQEEMKENITWEHQGLDRIRIDANGHESAFLTALTDEPNATETNGETTPITPSPTTTTTATVTHPLARSNSLPRLVRGRGMSGGNFGSPQNKYPRHQQLAHPTPSEVFSSPGIQEQLANQRTRMKQILMDQRGKRMTTRIEHPSSFTSTTDSVQIQPPPVYVSGGTKYLSTFSPTYKTVLAPTHIIQKQVSRKQLFN